MAFFFVSMNAEKVNCLLVIQLLTCVCFGLHFSRERRRKLQGVVSVLRPSFAFSRSLFLLFHLLNSTTKCIQQIYTTAHQCNFRELRLHVTYGALSPMSPKPATLRGEEQGSKSLSSLLFEPISPSSLNVYLKFSPSSQHLWGHFSLLPILFLPLYFVVRISIFSWNRKLFIKRVIKNHRVTIALTNELYFVKNSKFQFFETLIWQQGFMVCNCWTDLIKWIYIQLFVYLFA